MSGSPPTSPTSPSQHAATVHAYASNGLEILQAASDAAQQAIHIPQALQQAAAEAVSQHQQQQQQQQQEHQSNHHHQHHQHQSDDTAAASGLLELPREPAAVSAQQSLVPRPSSEGVTRDPNVNPKLTRLRRACDLCSRRKVKCDDSSIPCQPCRELGADCTWERETKRRGPPNKHVEAAKAAKRARLEAAAGMAASPSPHTAAKTLMNISADGVPLGAESIAPMPVLELLVDDFFTYIHPSAPFPHEPTFRQSFAHREDRTRPEFLGLLASMIGVLVASFPRSGREYLKTPPHSLQQFPKAVVLVDKCRDIVLLTRGSKWILKQPKSLDDACTSYFLGLAGAHTLQWNPAMHFLAETLTLLRELGFTTPSIPGELPTFGADRFSQDPLPFNHVNDQVGKRLFWCLLMSVRSLNQLGINGADLVIPPSTPSLPYPEYPENVDDNFILANEISHQADGGGVTLLTGFRIGIDICTTMNGIVSLELAYGMSTLPWVDQRSLLRDGLMAAKCITESLPPELQLAPQGEDAHSLAALDESGLQYVPVMWPNVQPTHDVRNVIKAQPRQRRRLQHEIQTANMFVSQLVTRAHFVDMYFNLRDVHLAEEQSEPTKTDNADAVQDVRDGDDRELHESMAAERELIVQNLLDVLGSMSQRNMEPSGMSLLYKIRQVASRLVNDAQDRKGPVALRSDETLAQLVEILTKLEKTGPAAPGRATDPTQMTAEDEEEELAYWAELREYQLRLAATGAFANSIVQ